MKRALIARRSVQVFKPALDDRYGAENVRSHDRDSFVGTPVRTASEMLNLLAPDTSVVAIDEVFLRPQLLALAERVDKLTAICVVCGEVATRT